MVDLLVLVRHGAAEGRPDVGDDASRTLTTAGRRALEATLPRALSLLDCRGGVSVWSSPAVRARETADVVVRALGTGGVTECPFLYDQDVDAFFRELSSAHARVVVAVGHNPFMEQVARSLDVGAPRLGKGAVAAFELSGEPGGRSSLAWFVQGPDVVPWETLGRTEGRLVAASERVGACLQAFLDDPGDAEALHRYRVAVRTMRSLLTFVEPFQGSGQARSLSDDLRGLVRPTSRLRELDILCEQVEAMEAERPALGSALLSCCRELRADECARVVETLRRRRSRRRVRRVGREAGDIRWKASAERSGLRPERLRARLDAMRARFDAEAHASDLADVRATHELRKDAKRIRYVASELGDLLGVGPDDVSSEMARVQDELGSLCDARVSRAIIATIDATDLPAGAVSELRLLDERQDELIRSMLRAGPAA